MAPQISVQLPKNKAGTVYGGTTATTSSETQQATFDSLLLRATPGTYNVTFSAPDHPVMRLQTCLSHPVLAYHVNSVTVVFGSGLACFVAGKDNKPASDVMDAHFV